MLNKIVAHTRNGCKFDVRNYIEVHNGRGSCPSCEQDGKIKQKNLQVNDDGKYWCYRGCTPEQIRAALNAPLPNSTSPASPTPHSALRTPHSALRTPHSTPRTFTQKQVQQSVDRLLKANQPDQQQAIVWLTGRGFTHEMIRHYQIGLERYAFKLKEGRGRDFWAIALHIPVPNQPGQFYRKLRIAPWLTGDDRPEGLSRWSQFGVPVTVWITYQPENASETWFCEGEWDALRLGWEARQQSATIAIAGSTAGCGTLPKPEHLDQLPGKVTIFFDRNDEPRKDGVIPGDVGAQKLALALGDRGVIAQVPMPDDCPIAGWDVSNALDVGYTWQDFLTAASLACPPILPSSHPPIPPSPSLRDQILTILRQHEAPGQRELALMELAQATGYYYRDISQLAQALTIEVDLQTNQAEAIQKLHNLINTRHIHLDLHRYLEPGFAQLLIDTAQAMPTAPEMLFTTLLPAAASRIGTAARVVVKPSAKYTQPLVFWAAVVADSGALKTPVQRVITDPLIALEKEAHDRYQLDLADYKAEQQSTGKSQDGEYRLPPTRKRYLTKDVTLETLQRIHSENPRGILYYRDELVGNAKARNMYRGGAGADEEAELDQWNGAAILYDRAEKSVCLAQSAVSRTGAYQWETLSQLMGDHTDFNGGFARWLLCAPKLPRRYLRLLQDDQDTGISDVLLRLYRDLEQLPAQDYLLSYEAKQLLETWQHQLVDAQITEPAVGLRAVYPKIESYTSRLALWLHLVNATLRGDRPTQVITGDTMERAIELAAYYLWQYRLIYTHNSPDAGLEGPSLKLQRYAEKVGRVTASQAKSGVYALRRMPVEQIRQLMQTLVAAGHGAIDGDGSDAAYVPTQPSQPSALAPLPVGEGNQPGSPPCFSSFSPCEKGEQEDEGISRQLINSAAIDPPTEQVIAIDPDPQLPDQSSTITADITTDDDTVGAKYLPQDLSSIDSAPPANASPPQSITTHAIDQSSLIDHGLQPGSTTNTHSQSGFQAAIGEIDPELGTATSSAPIAPASLSVGDRVHYIGNHPNLQRQYPGNLMIRTITTDGISCLTDDNRITTWLPPADLRRTDPQRTE